MLSLFAGMNNVDGVPLLINKASTGYISVTMYVDDQGVLKELPLNLRASQLAAAVGNPVRVMGDAFVAMVYDNDDDFERLDFGMDELRSGPWIAAAQADAKARAEKNGQVTPLTSIRDVDGACAAACGKNGVQRCSRCKSVKYCSKECQKRHWKFHKKVCTPAAPAAPSSSSSK